MRGKRETPSVSCQDGIGEMAVTDADFNSSRETSFQPLTGISNRSHISSQCSMAGHFPMDRML